MTESLDLLRTRPHLSVSAMKMWLACPRKFRLHYVDRVPASHRSIALVFGHAWHELLGHVLLLHRRGEESRPADLKDYFAAALEREIQSDGPPVLFEEDEGLRELVDTAAAMLEAFLQSVPLPQPSQVLHVELPFRLELSDPDTGEVLPVPLIGAIDAVVGDERRLELWELKSGKKRWSEDAVLFDFQPTAYRMAVRSMSARRLERPKVHLKLLVTTKAKNPDVQLEELVRTGADERNLMETAASIVRAVQAGCAHPVRGWPCKTCEYGHVCE